MRATKLTTFLDAFSNKHITPKPSMREYKIILVEQLPNVMQYALALIGNYQAAEDLVQDTLGQALNNYASWDSRKAIKPWLFTFLYAIFLNRRNQQNIYLENEWEFDNNTPQPIRVHPNLLMIKDMLRKLNSLPAEQRAILLLVTLEGLNYQQVSDIANLPIGKVMSQLHQGRVQLVAQSKLHIQRTTTEQSIS